MKMHNRVNTSKKTSFLGGWNRNICIYMFSQKMSINIVPYPVLIVRVLPNPCTPFIVFWVRILPESQDWDTRAASYCPSDKRLTYSVQHKCKSSHATQQNCSSHPNTRILKKKGKYSTSSWIIYLQNYILFRYHLYDK